MPFDQTRFYVRANGISLHYLEHGGSGPAVVLLPGITSPAIMWAFVAERLAESTHVYTLDNRGRGLSERGPHLTYTLDDYAADVAGFVTELGLGPVAVLGHSMGARIAIRLAARFPGVAARVLLADPPLSGPGRRPYPSRLDAYLVRLDAALRGDETAPGGVPETPAQARLRREWLPTCDRDAIVATHRGFHEEEIFADLPCVTCPAHLLYAERGDVIGDADAAEVTALLPRGTSAKLANVAHMMPWYDCDAFIAATLPFLTGEGA